jgi:hypothetical protein
MYCQLSLKPLNEYKTCYILSRLLPAFFLLYHLIREPEE